MKLDQRECGRMNPDYTGILDALNIRIKTGVKLDFIRGLMRGETVEVVHSLYDNKTWLELAKKVNKLIPNSRGVCTYGYGSKTTMFSLVQGDKPLWDWS